MDTKRLEKIILKQPPDKLLMAAENGDTNAMFYAGYMYHKGLCLPQNTALAITLLEQTVTKARHKEAAYVLAQIYLMGNETDYDFEKGYANLKIAALTMPVAAKFLNKIHREMAVQKKEGVEFKYHHLQEWRPLIKPAYINFLNSACFFTLSALKLTICAIALAIAGVAGYRR